MTKNVTPEFTVNSPPPIEGQRLPVRLQPTLEAFFGSSFDEVSIHISHAPGQLGVRAFAMGEQIHFAPGQYDPDSDAGLRVLGHELAHVIQQRSGRVAVSRDGKLVRDPELEKEADLAGELLARAVREDATPDEAFYAPVSRMRQGVPRAIQCIWQWEDFKSESSAMGRRNKIVPVDNAVKQYHTVIGTNPVNWQALQNANEAIKTTGQAYIGERPTSSRRAAVDQLMRQNTGERPPIDHMVRSSGAADPDEQWDHVDDAYEAYKALEHYMVFDNLKPNLMGKISEIRGPLKDTIKNTAKGPEVVMNDLEELRAIADSGEVPGIISAVIVEATSPQNVAQLDFSFAGASAKYNVTKSATKKYTLNHELLQSEGKKFRLGSLLHELTHISIAETFGHSVIMLACPPSATDEEMMQLVNLRKANILNLVKAVENSPDSSSGLPDGLSVKQKKELTDKLEYAISTNQGAKYLQLLRNFHKVKIVSRPVAQRQVDLAARIAGLQARGMACELTEYDTVINQTMLWCHLWRVHPENEVYGALQVAAHAAHTYRAYHRTRRREIVSPMTDLKYDRTLGRRMSIG